MNAMTSSANEDSEDVSKTVDSGGSLERRARLYRVHGIVLRRRDLGETDRIVTLLTLEHGKRRIVAKGSRRPASRLAGHLEPFAATRLLVARTRGLDIVSQAETIEVFAGLRTDEAAIATAGYVAELVDALLPEEQASDAVYDLLYATYGLLAEGRDARLVTRVFEMAFLRHIGYRPELRQCVVCEQAVEPVLNGFSLDGGVVCHRCLDRRPDVMRVSVNALKLLRTIDRGEFGRLFGLRVPPDVWAEVDAILARYITRLTGRESGARRVLSELNLDTIE
jgi:DNA repair protein RecO (recombination protein O)